MSVLNRASHPSTFSGSIPTRLRLPEGTLGSVVPPTAGRIGSVANHSRVFAVLVDKGIVPGKRMEGLS